ncbi:MAG TPA: nickel-dependent lactate racemase [Syntrophomonas sp.]|nr:nickel-dependent lactate racemase [Syntrophomonas sp.]
MKHRLAYGKEWLEVDIPDQNLAAILKPGSSKETPANVQDNNTIIRQALNHPVGSQTIGEIIKRKSARSAVVIVNDITRPTPYRWMLPPLLEAIEAGGIPPEQIKLVIALGIHRPHTREENRQIFGTDICARYQVINHDCDGNLSSLGRLSNGWDLLINRDVAEADLLISTGVVELHYFAGWSGGRKSILPGVAARSLIEANHRMMDDPRACLGNYTDNPVNDLMLEAARTAGLDFILNVVTAGKEEIIYAAAGDVYQAWLEAVKYAEAGNLVHIEKPVDVVIASCGGFPKDINVYQSQKALDAAVQAVKPGGTIIWVAECREGMGEDTFAEWIADAGCPEDIEKRFFEGFELGGHKAFAICRILKKADILMVSSLPGDMVKAMFVTPCPDLSQALNMARQKHGPGMSVIIMPQAPRIAVRQAGQA